MIDNALLGTVALALAVLFILAGMELVELLAAKRREADEKAARAKRFAEEWKKGTDRQRAKWWTPPQTPPLPGTVDKPCNPSGDYPHAPGL